MGDRAKVLINVYSPGNWPTNLNAPHKYWDKHSCKIYERTRKELKENRGLHRYYKRLHRLDGTLVVHECNDYELIVRTKMK